MNNLIQLPNLDFHDVSSLFSCKDFDDSNILLTIMKVIYLRESLLVLIKEKLGLSEDEEIPENLIPSTFSTLKEETAMLDDESMLM
jgi:hypothetical protein